VLLYFSRSISGIYKYSLGISQIFMVSYLAAMLPTPIQSQGETFFAETTVTLYALLAITWLFALFDIFRRLRSVSKNNLSTKLISPYSIIVVLVFLFYGVSAVPNIFQDDYHLGEYLLPLQQISEFNSLPYVDYALAHGFTDMLSGLGTHLFLDGNATLLMEGGRIFKALILIASFFIAYRYLGLLTASLMGLLMASIGPWYVIAVACAIVIFFVKEKYVGMAYLISAILLFIANPGLGAVFTVCLLPPALVRAWQSGTMTYNLTIAGILGGALLGLAASFPSILDMTWAAIRYALENGSIALQSYGVAWKQSWDSTQTQNSSLLLFEIARNSWILFPFFAFTILNSRTVGKNLNAFLYALMVTAFLMIAYKYTLGRIDPYILSRPGIISAFFLPLSLLFLYIVYKKSPPLPAYLLLFFFLGILSPRMHLAPIQRAHQLMPQITPLTVGKDIGIPNLGTGLSKPDHINRIRLLKTIADSFLDSKETFIDVSNRSALYYYLDRRIPIEATPYNLPHRAMQLRSVERLSDNPPPLAILSASNLNHDSGTVSLRTYYLYRWIMANYIPIKISEVIVGIHKSKISRFYARIADNQKIKDVIPIKRSIAIADITDGNWENGISRSTATFAIRNVDINHNLLRPLSRLRLADGSTRLIKSTAYSADYINVQVHGGLLDSKTIGYPGKVYFEGSLDITLPTNTEQIYLWSQAFYLRELKKLPVAWGRTMDSLRSRLKLVTELDADTAILSDITRLRSQEYSLSGSTPSISFDLKPHAISGKTTGVLGFEMSCENQQPIKIAVSWMGTATPQPISTAVFNGENGQLLIPLDYAPSWLLSDKLSSIKLRLENASSCRKIHLADFALYSRRK